MIHRLVALWHAHMTPARAARIRWFGRVLAYQVVGAVLGNASALAAYALIHFHSDPATVTLFSWFAGAVAGGLHQGMAIPQDATPADIPTLPPPPIGGNP
jgi:hypothetical protein